VLPIAGGYFLRIRLAAPLACSAARPRDTRFFVQQLETLGFVEAAGNLYIGLGDQFDDDRRRIHQAE
jgi:hypothetical protein